MAEDYREKFKILPHTADLKVKIFGKKKEELYQNALLAMSCVLEPETEKNKRIERKVRVKSPNEELLLADFLSEALYLSQVNKEVYNKIKLSKLTPKLIEGVLIGQKVIRFGEDIKGVTYHNLKIAKKGPKWEATVLFDV
jgi:SHS2 domain-containing protein